MSLHNPCYMCIERELGCHDNCKSYIDWKTERDEVADRKRAEEDIKEHQAKVHEKRMQGKWRKR